MLYYKRATFWQQSITKREKNQAIGEGTMMVWHLTSRDDEAN